MIQDISTSSDDEYIMYTNNNNFKVSFQRTNRSVDFLALLFKAASRQDLEVSNSSGNVESN